MLERDEAWLSQAITSLFSLPALGFPGFLSAMGVLSWGVWMLPVPTKQRKLCLVWGSVFAEVQTRTAPWGGNAAFRIPHPFDLQCPPDHFTSSLDSGASAGEGAVLMMERDR